MRKPLFKRSHRWRVCGAADASTASRERGVTMVLVAVAMVAIIGMAALSIDVITLYLAKEEAQRSADEAALAAARILSLSGITGDPANTAGKWGAICGPDDGSTQGLAARAAKAVVTQNTIAQLAATSVDVTYSAGSTTGMASSNDCQTLAGSAFGVNPLVTVHVTRASLPSFFSRLWGNPGQNVTATATAEAFNSSNTGNVGNQNTGTIIPVKPWCVKPWVVPNLDPLHPALCTPGLCQTFVNTATGQITNPGISTAGNGNTGVIGETFWLGADCQTVANRCVLRRNPTGSGPEQQPQPNFNNGNPTVPPVPNLLYAPGQVDTQALAVPTCTTGNPFNEAVVGCDQNTNYTCGVPPASGGTNVIDLTENPRTPTADAASCLIHQTDTTNLSDSSGQDYLSQTPLGSPAAYPFQIFAGSNNPGIGAALTTGTPVTSSPSIVSIPIYDQTTPPTLTDNTATPTTFVGFLQVFINAFDTNGNVNVTVLNVAGCSNGTGTPVSGNPIIGTSPVPVRLITPP